MNIQPSLTLTERYAAESQHYVVVQVCFDCKSRPRAIIRTPWGDEFLSCKCRECARTPENSWRGLAIVRMPSGEARYWEQWFTPLQISNSLAMCNRMLGGNALRDAEQYQ